jgi:hypothetical protein
MESEIRSITRSHRAQMVPMSSDGDIDHLRRFGDADTVRTPTAEVAHD